MRHRRKPATPKPYREREEDRKAVIRLIVLAVVIFLLVIGGIIYGLNRLSKKMLTKTAINTTERPEESIHRSGGFLKRLAPRHREESGTSAGGGAAEDADLACRKRLQSIRKLSQEYQSAYGSPPPNLEALGVSRQAAICPKSKEAYVFSPASGQVSCPCSAHITY